MISGSGIAYSGISSLGTTIVSAVGTANCASDVAGAGAYIMVSVPPAVCVNSGGVVTFSYERWNACYPEFSNIDEVRAGIFWQEATLYHNNTGTSRITDSAQQEMLLFMLTSHIAFLRVGTASNPSPASQGIVGRVSSASMGPVSVSTELQGVPGTAAWFASSVYGFQYWQATAAYRTMTYRAFPGRRFGFGGRR